MSQVNKRHEWRPWHKVVLTVLLGLFALVIIISAAVDEPQSPGNDGGDRSITAEIMCEDFVKQRLKAPASAEFTDPRTVSTPEGVYTVTGDVDSQNSFGAMIRDRYQCKVSNDGSDEWRLVDLTFSDSVGGPT